MRDSGAGFTTIASGLPLATVQYTDNTVLPMQIYKYKTYLYAADTINDSTNISQSILAIHWSVADNSYNIGAVFGDYVPGNTWKYHEGVDFVEYLKKLTAIRGGEIYRPEISNEQIGIIKIDIGGGNYEYDYYVHLEDTLKFQGKMAMFAGENIGVIDSGAYHLNYNHLHYTVTNLFDATSPLTYGINDQHGSNLLNPLKVFDDVLYNDSVSNPTDPYNLAVEVDTVYYTVNNILSNVLNKNLLYGRTDIYAGCTDKMNNFADPKIKNPGIYKSGYWIESIIGGGADVKNDGTPYIVCEYNNDWFDNVVSITQTFKGAAGNFKFIDFSRADTVYGTPTNNIPYNKYLTLTNTTSTTGNISELDEDQYWNLWAEQGTYLEANASDAPSPAVRCNEAMAFKDGKYAVHIIAEDLVHATDYVDTVIVDNFIPFVKNITIKSNDIAGDSIYNAS